jgi:hypothetical protein
MAVSARSSPPSVPYCNRVPTFWLLAATYWPQKVLAKLNLEPKCQQSSDSKKQMQETFSDRTDAVLVAALANLQAKQKLWKESRSVMNGWAPPCTLLQRQPSELLLQFFDKGVHLGFLLQKK